MDVTLFKTFSHMVIMTRKVDPLTEKGTGIFIKESSIKAIDASRVLGKARLILFRNTHLNFLKAD
jgi:hypothetical protein